MPRSIGLDFGTTNSALALADGDEVTLARFATSDGAPTTDTFRSILYFDPNERDRRGRPVGLAGPQAIARYLASTGGGRLMQSLKSQLASKLFTGTQVFGRAFTLDELLAVLLSAIRAQAEASLGALPKRAVVGRPVRFVNAEKDEDDALAIGRLRAALGQAGFEDVVFEYEPVAAAHHYERTLDHDELVLIADFGGGTSDFSLVEVGPRAKKGARRILGNDGVGIAGDAFDAELVLHAVAPELGMGSLYRLPFDTEGRTMEMPPYLYQRLKRWHHLSFLKSKETMDQLEELRKQALEPEKIEAFVHVVQADLGFHLYKSVEKAKVALSGADATPFSFVDEPVHVERTLARADFERWIAAELASITACIDRILGAAKVSSADVDRVFMTGGSSLVPAVRQVFAARFGESKLRGGDELTSVAMGLAVRSAELS